MDLEGVGEHDQNHDCGAADGGGDGGGVCRKVLVFRRRDFDYLGRLGGKVEDIHIEMIFPLTFDP